MTDRPYANLFGTEAPDPGCEAAFEVLDRYVEALLRGGDVASVFAHVVAHLENCVACREDTEGLLAALRAMGPPPPAT